MNNKDNKDTKSHMSFSNYALVNDTPQYVEFKDRNGWISWGKNNLYPNYLISLTNRSSLHNAIVHLKSNMIGKNGFINANWKPDTIQFVKNMANRDDLEEILAKISLDLVIFGGFCLNIRWSKDRSKIAEINYISPDSVRIAVPDEDTAYPDNEDYYVCEDWKNVRKNKPVRFAGFSTINKKEASQILYVKEHRSSNNWYPVPEYLAGVSLMELNYQINEFHLNTVKNQFSPSMHINFPYVPQSDEEREQIVKRLKTEFQGAKTAGNVVITFAETKDNAPSIDPIQMNDSDTRFQELTKAMMEGIVSAHTLTDKKLLGLDTTGDLGSHKNELLESLNIFQSMYVAQKQFFIGKIFNYLARINGVTDKLIIEKYDNNLSTDIPMGDLLSLLESTLTDRQKVEILISKGYDRQEAELLVNVNQQQPIQKPVVVQPTQNITKN